MKPPLKIVWVASEGPAEPVLPAARLPYPEIETTYTLKDGHWSMRMKGPVNVPGSGHPVRVQPGDCR